MRLLRRPLLILGAACTLVVSLSGQTVRVLSVTGEATLQAPGEAAPRAVQKGDTIIVGTRIITGEGARVILTPLPGVNSIIAPSSDLVIERASITREPGAKSALHTAVLDLKTGAVTTDLQKVEGVTLDYGVRTARGLAGARGTTYTVAVNVAGIQTIVVADGVISLTLADGRTLSLVPGQVTITRPDGTTQSVTRASELSEGDQALTDDWVDTTLAALAEAVEQGVDIDPAALEDAARTARDLGADVPPETQGRLDRARDTLLERREARDRELRGGAGPGRPADENSQLVTQDQQPGTPVSGFDLAAFLALVPPDLRSSFLDLPEPERRGLGAYFARLTTFEQRLETLTFAVGLDGDLSAFLARSDSIRSLLVTNSGDSALINFALSSINEGSELRPGPVVLYFAGLDAQRRSVYEFLPLDLQLDLVNTSDSRLASFALDLVSGEPRSQDEIRFFFGLTSGQRTAFLALPPETQSDLASANLSALTTYALAVGRTAEEVDFALALDPQTQLGAFLALSSTLQNKLILANDPALNAYALESARTNAEINFAASLPSDRRATFFDLGPTTQLLLVNHAGDTQLLSYALDPYSEGLSRSETDIAFFFNLPAPQRNAFLALELSTQEALIATTIPDLVTYALAQGRTPEQVAFALSLNSSEFAAFYALPPSTQSTLVNASADTALLDYALRGGTTPPPASIELFATLTETQRTTFLARPADLQDFAGTDIAFAALLLSTTGEGSAFEYSDTSLRHYLTLSAPAQIAYLARGVEVREGLAAYGRAGFTTALLTATFFDDGLAPTDESIRRAVESLSALSIQNRDLFETFAGGSTYPDLESVPSPTDFGDSAWTRTRNSYASLPSAARTRLLNLGAFDGIFDYSGTFIEAALADYDNTLSPADRTAIQAAGWGRFFADYFANDDLRPLLADASGFTVAEQSAIKRFRISPYAFEDRGVVVDFDSRGEGGSSDPKANLAVLAGLSVADRDLLAVLVKGDSILNQQRQGVFDPQTENFTPITYAQYLADGLAFARSLDADQLLAIREMGIGYALLANASDDQLVVNETPVTARDRIIELIGVYQGLDAVQRDTARDLGLFSFSFIGDSRLDPPILASAINSWFALAPQTRDYLAEQSDIEVDFLELFTNSESSYANLSELDAILSGLSANELTTLRELKAAGSLLFPNFDAYSETGLISLGDLQLFIAYVDGLNDLQRFTLRELGITGRSAEKGGLFLSDQEGLTRLLQAYSELPATLRAETRQLDPDGSNRDYTGRSFFFATDKGFSSNVIINVGFSSPGDLHVGATRRLALSGVSNTFSHTFNVPAGKDIYLRASTLIDLDSVTFSAGLRAITMEAATINLANLDFPEGSVLSLNSKLGGTGTGNKYPNFGSTVPGRVNFISGVSYGGAGNIMDSESTFDLHSRGNISIGTLQNRAPLPAFTPPPPPQQLGIQ